MGGRPVTHLRADLRGATGFAAATKAPLFCEKKFSKQETGQVQVKFRARPSGTSVFGVGGQTEAAKGPRKTVEAISAQSLRMCAPVLTQTFFDHT